jgi:hypothetical protein
VELLAKFASLNITRILVQDREGERTAFRMEEVGSRMHKYSAPFTQREWLARLQSDETFAMDFIGILQSSPFKA